MAKGKNKASQSLKRWIPRFGLRTLFFSVLVAAIAIGWSERRAQNQAALTALIKEWRGEYGLADRPLIPRSWREPLGPTRASYISWVRVSGFLAPPLRDHAIFGFPGARGQATQTFTAGQHESWRSYGRRPYGLVSPKRMERLLRSPAMQNVQRIQLSGSTISDRMIPALIRMQDLEIIDLQCTSLTQQGLDALQAAKPNCVVNCDSPGSGLSVQRTWNSMQLMTKYVADLSIFARARDGEIDAVRELITVVAKHGQIEDFAGIFREIEDERCREVLRDGLQHESSNVRLELVNAIGQRRSEYLTRALRDESQRVRNAALINIVAMREPEFDLLREAFEILGSHSLPAAQFGQLDKRQRIATIANTAKLVAHTGKFTEPDAFAILLDALNSPHETIRYAAIEGIGRHRTASSDQALIRCTKDPVSQVRAAAVRLIGERPITSEMRVLLEAMRNDEDSFVRERASSALLNAKSARSLRGLVGAKAI